MEAKYHQREEEGQMDMGEAQEVVGRKSWQQELKSIPSSGLTLHLPAIGKKRTLLVVSHRICLAKGTAVANSVFIPSRLS